MRYWLWSLVLSFGLLVGGAGIADHNQTITDDIDPVGITEGPDPIPGAIAPAGSDPSPRPNPRDGDRRDL